MRSEEAEAELTLRVADNKAGYFGVSLDQRAKTNPYLAQVRRGGKMVYLGSFATAEEAALCIARSPEGQAAAERAAERAASQGKKRKPKAFNKQRAAKKLEESGLSEEELARRQQGLFAEARQLLPTTAHSVPGSSSEHGGGSSASAAWGPLPQRSTSLTEVLKELAAKREASGEGRAGRAGREGREGRAAAAAEEAEAVARAVFRQAQVEGLRLRNSDKSATGFSNVYQDGERFRAQVSRGGKTLFLGRFASAEEAALQVAREGDGGAEADSVRQHRAAAARRRERAGTTCHVVSPGTRATSGAAGSTGGADAGSGSVSAPAGTCHCRPSQAQATHVSAGAARKRPAVEDDDPPQPAAYRSLSQQPAARHPPWTVAPAAAVWDGARGDGEPGDVWRVRGWGGGAANTTATTNANAASGYARPAATAAPPPSRQRSGGVAVAVRVGDVIGGAVLGVAAPVAAAAAAAVCANPRCGMN